MTINEDFNMAKTILGIDIGYDNLKLALVNGRQVLRTASFPMPKNLVRDGNIVSDESMGELLRTRKTLCETEILFRMNPWENFSALLLRRAA